MQKCKIGEKHMALSAMNSDKRLYLESSNDRMRCRIVKERQLVSTDQKVFVKAQKQYLHPAAAMPDLEKFNPKEIKKALAEKKQ